MEDIFDTPSGPEIAWTVLLALATFVTAMLQLG